MSWREVWNVQKDKGGRNRLSIIKELSKENLTFKQLESKIDIHKTTLARHLKELRKVDEVFKIYDKKLERDVYSATNETIIKRLILPELLGYCGANLLKRLLISKEKREPIYELPKTSHFINELIKVIVKDKYPHRKIEPREIIEVMEKIPEIAYYIRQSEKYEKAWLEGMKYEIQCVHPILENFERKILIKDDKELEWHKNQAKKHGVTLKIRELQKREDKT